MANASKELQKLGLCRIPRITAMDPGRHGFDQESADSIRLCKEDADLVDIIHTSRIGFLEPLGHIDFYPNGGESQVCEGAGDKVNFCDLQAGGGWEHQRAVQYYEESILGYTKFRSLRAESWDQFREMEEELVCAGEDLVCMGEHPCQKKCQTKENNT